MKDTALKKPYSDRRWYDDPRATVVLCSICQRFKVDISKEKRKLICEKYIDGIPNEYVDLIAGEDKNPICFIPKEQ